MILNDKVTLFCPKIKNTTTIWKLIRKKKIIAIFQYAVFLHRFTAL